MKRLRPPAYPAALLLGALVLIACGTDAPPADTPQPAPAYPAAQPNTPTVHTAEAGPIPSSTASVRQTPAPSESAFTPTPIPLSTPSPPPTVEYDALSGPEQVEALAAFAMQTLTALTADLSPRPSAGEGERIAADYLQRGFASQGYDAWIQEFDVRAISPYERLLTIVEPQTLDIFAFPMWMTAEGQVSARIVDASRALPDGAPLDDLAGKIALIERGETSFDEKVSRVAAAGALGGIVYNDEPGAFVGTLTEELIPVVSISQEDGERIKSLMEDGPVTAALDLVYTERSQNVIADKPGASNEGSVVVLGGHYDTVPGVPGANDNGSGIAALLTIARTIADRQYPFTVRFAAFGAEELGLFGSRHYVDRLSNDEIASTMAMVNFDALGSGPVTAAGGSPDLLRKIADYADERGIDLETSPSLTANIGSDHTPFDEAGVPYVFFTGEDLSRIHTPDDTLEFVDAPLLGTSAALTIALLDILAKDQIR